MKYTTLTTANTTKASEIAKVNDMTKRDHSVLVKSLQRLGGQHQQRTLELSIYERDAEVLKTFKALASEPRLRILEHLKQPNKLSNLSEIAQDLSMNLATVTMHINILEEAGLILCEHIPGERGTQRVCGCFMDWINIHMSPKAATETGKLLEHKIPIGSFTSFEVTPTCGLFSEHKQIGHFDDPVSFYEPERIHAQLLWFTSGFVEYRVPHHLNPNAVVESLSLSMEVCSEAPMYHEDWPSDITIWINDVDIGCWTSPAEFGGVRGKLTPAWQPTHATQYGLLKTWQVTRQDTRVDGDRISELGLEPLGLQSAPYVSVRIGVKEDAAHVGGINIFGQKFGNHAQDIVLSLRYH